LLLLNNYKLLFFTFPAGQNRAKPENASKKCADFVQNAAFKDAALRGNQRAAGPFRTFIGNKKLQRDFSGGADGPGG
jgi:hypothetical protein